MEVGWRQTSRDHAIVGEFCTTREDRWNRAKVAESLLEKVLVNFLDVKGVFNPASDIVADHKFG
jgi:hypothetical protein